MSEPSIYVTPSDAGPTSTTGSIWNHFGRMGLVTPAGVESASYDRAFYYALHTTEAIAPTDLATCLVFPVNPEEIASPRTRVISAIDVVGGQQRSQVGQVQLRILTLSSFFPASFDSEYCRGIKLDRTPEGSRKFIEDTMALTKPVYLSVMAEAAPIDQQKAALEKMTCFVTGFSVSRQAGHPLDLFFDLELTEYVEQDIISQTFSRAGGPKNPIGGKHPNPYAITTGAGWKSTLAGIAGHPTVYGKDWGGAGGKWLMSQNPNLKNTKGNNVTTVSEKLKAKQKVMITTYGGAQAGRPNIANVNVF